VVNYTIYELSSRAQKDRPLADDPAESRDLLCNGLNSDKIKRKSRSSTAASDSHASPILPLKMTALRNMMQCRP